MSLIISACTKRKKGDVEAQAEAVPAGALDRVGPAWLAAVGSSQRMARASDLYQGRSHSESEHAARETGYPHLIVSAGLGLIHADDLVPHYAASILPGRDNILDRIEGDITPATWWAWLQRHSPFARSLSEAILASDGPCLIALPRAYVAMIAGELASLPPTAFARLRIFSGATLPAPLDICQMPYDSRLDGPDSAVRGTLSNFAARALHHFGREILPGRESESNAAHRAAVAAHLASWRSPKRIAGARKTDAEIRAILQEHWEATGGSATRLLRVLRDDLGIACEQSRFAALARAMKQARA